MLTIQKCRQLLSKTGETLTDEQVREVRDLLYLYADIAIQNYFENDDKQSDEEGRNHGSRKQR